MWGKWGVYGLIKEAMLRDGVCMMKSNGYWQLIKMGMCTYTDGWVYVVHRRLLSPVNERVKGVLYVHFLRLFSAWCLNFCQMVERSVEYKWIGEWKWGKRCRKWKQPHPGHCLNVMKYQFKRKFQTVQKDFFSTKPRHVLDTRSIHFLKSRFLLQLLRFFSKWRNFHLIGWIRKIGQRQWCMKEVQFEVPQKRSWLWCNDQSNWNISRRSWTQTHFCQNSFGPIHLISQGITFIANGNICTGSFYMQK